MKQIRLARIGHENAHQGEKKLRTSQIKKKVKGDDGEVQKPWYLLCYLKNSNPIIHENPRYLKSQKKIYKKKIYQQI